MISEALAAHPTRSCQARHLTACRLVAFCAVLAFLFAIAGVAHAEAPVPNRAGLVVHFGDGNVQTACVDLGPDGELSGEALLARSGLSPVMEYSPMGGSLCQLDGIGCAYPARSCWCQCQGDPCIYWAYYHLTEDHWVYSTMGASSHVVRPGDVEGWSWGAGDLTSGSVPPLFTFDELCAAGVAEISASAGVLPTGSGETSDRPSMPKDAAPNSDISSAMAYQEGQAIPRDPATGQTVASPKDLPSKAVPQDSHIFLTALATVLVVGMAGLGLGKKWLAQPSERRFFSSSRQREDAAPHASRMRTVGWRLTGWSIYALSAGIGIVALAYPFVVQIRQTAAQNATRTGDTSFLLIALVGLCLLALLVEVQRQSTSAKMLALLGVLVSINAILRFVEVGIPGPGGFSPVFFLTMLTGYVYGSQFGFLMGVLTILVSALITGGMGPWMPAQMFTASWVGLTAPLARPLVRAAGGTRGSRTEVLVLAAFGGLWGLIYGLIINLWFWPFMAGPAGQYWQAGLALGDTLRRYVAFYLATSLVWDSVRVIGNAALILAFGAPTLRALRRFRQRFSFKYDGVPDTPPKSSQHGDRRSIDPEIAQPALFPGRGR